MTTHYADLNGTRVASGQITIPYYGVWHADLLLADELTVPTTALGLTLTLAALVLKGTAFRTATYGGATSVRMIGGAGGWRKTLPAKYYRLASGLSLSTVLNDAARESGETITLASDRIIGTAYVRESGPASKALATLSGGLWYVDFTGRTQVATRAASTIASEFDTVSVGGAGGKQIVATEFPQDFVPGRTYSSSTFSSKTISSVTHLIDGAGKFRTEVLSTP
jgi:hypothetical protein